MCPRRTGWCHTRDHGLRMRLRPECAVPFSGRHGRRQLSRSGGVETMRRLLAQVRVVLVNGPALCLTLSRILQNSRSRIGCVATSPAPLRHAIDHMRPCARGAADCHLTLRGEGVALARFRCRSQPLAIAFASVDRYCQSLGLHITCPLAMILA